MLTVTDIAAVDAAFQAKQPRPWRDVVLEIYPDATEDRNGRFHAPYDGYECQLTGRSFKAGEYLPYSEPDDGYRMMGGPRSYPKAQDVHGVIHDWDGTKAQNLAVWAVLIEQTKAYDASRSNWIGEIGQKKVTITATINHVHRFEGAYGTICINIMRTAEGNVVIYKGAKPLGRKDEAVMFTCTIKDHSEREGVKQTVVMRPKMF